MKKKNKIPLTVALLSILAYSNQGISDLPQQCLYYLTREHWNLSASTIGLISWITGLAWYVKIVWGFLADKIKNTKKSLIVCYSSMLLVYTAIIIFGLNLYSLIIAGTLINVFIGYADTNVDREMVKAEKMYNLRSRLQSVQWTALGIGGLVVALGGAFIAKYFPVHVDYKVAYGLAGVIPLAMLFYLIFKFKSPTVEIKKKTKLKASFKKLKNKKLLLGLLFIACLNFAPSFGTALMIKARETLMVDKMFLGYLGAMGTVLGVVGYLLYYKWAYQFPLKKLIYFMVIFTALTNLFYLYIPNKWYLLIYNVVFGAFGGISFMALLAFFLKIIPTGNEGLFYALVTSTNNFCARGGNYFGGLIYDFWGYSATVIVSTLFTLACLMFIPYLGLEKQRRKNG